jgi:hypothetical protein
MLVTLCPLNHSSLSFQPHLSYMETYHTDIIFSAVSCQQLMLIVYFCPYIQTGVRPARVFRPLAYYHTRSPPRPLGDVAYGPGLTAGTVVSGPSPSSLRSGASACHGRQGSTRVASADPDSQGGPGPPRVMAGPPRARPLQPTSGARTPLPPGRGPVPPRAAPAKGAGLALPRACGRRPFAGLQPTHQHLMR